ncbi:MAG: L,D-transpeptidase [Xanthobacteraceae bacterium]|jgi:lipoprotein-anchoring transpeptidase ErfK/SrfK
MRRICISALVFGAFSVPAIAGPLSITPGTYNAAQGVERDSVPVATIPGAPVAAAAAPVRVADAQANLGGGFIQFLFGGGPQGAAAPQTYPQATDVPAEPQPQTAALGSDPDAVSAEADDGGHAPVDAKYDRQVVAYTGKETPGTIIVDTPHKFLYLVEDSGKAMRYGIGVGRPGFTWAGVKTITAKREWPDWRPPEAMLKRQPELPRFMAGGPQNPLGARAMYLGSTDYRIHGSNEPWTIGHNVSSGCIRLRNADVIDLYSRVKVGSKVVVM